MRFAMLALVSLLPSTLPAQAADTITARDLAPGVAYRHFRETAGPWLVHVVRVDLRRPELELRHVRARNALRGRERASAMARRVGGADASVLAAVNADFYWLTTGENENNQVIDGEWWKGVKITDSPYDTFDNAHVQFSLDAQRQPAMERYQFEGKAIARGVATPILALNFNPSGKPEGTALYTTRFGATTPRDSTRATAEVPLLRAGRAGDTLLFLRVGDASASSGSAIPADGAVLAAYGPGARVNEIQAMKPGDTVRVVLDVTPRAGATPPRLVIGGWPRILRDGVNVATDAATVEGTISRNAEVRHPRSALGISRNGAEVIIVTIDGRRDTSVGATLAELASVMQRLGAWQAMNFDGGGSTTLVVNGVVVNQPSDPGGEREVGNALVILRKR